MNTKAIVFDAYGTLFDAGVPNFVFPSKMISSGRIQSKKFTAFKCGSLFKSSNLLTTP